MAHSITQGRSTLLLFLWSFPKQWCNRWGQGGRVPPRDFWPGNFCWPTRKKEARKKWKKGKMEKKRMKIVKGEVENWKWKEGKVPKWGEDFCFFFLSTFKKRQKFVLGLPKWKFSTGKKRFTPGKKSGKNDFAPSEKFSCYAPVPKAHIHVYMIISSMIVTSRLINILNGWAHKWMTSKFSVKISIENST